MPASWLNVREVMASASDDCRFGHYFKGLYAPMPSGVEIGEVAKAGMDSITIFARCSDLLVDSVRILWLVATGGGMTNNSETEVLVVGAGPVGMMTALMLTQAGIDVQIIDKAERTASQSYACGLHPHSLHLFRKAGMLDDVLETGHRIDTITFYDGDLQKAEVKLSELPGDFPFALALPQDALETILEDHLQRDRKCTVHWHHLLSRLHSARDGAVATVDKLGFNAQGYAVPHMEEVVESVLAINASFVVGADGPGSVVRKCLSIKSPELAPEMMFALCDFESETEFDHTARVVLNKGDAEMLWPLSRHMGRWTIQNGLADDDTLIPDKERMPFVIVQREDVKNRFEKQVRERAPWFTLPMRQIDWLVDLPYRDRLASRFGEGRCWLAGDAAHEGYPLGFHSLNAGLSEAVELVDALKRILRDDASLDLLNDYGKSRREQWQSLHELAPRAAAGADDWVKANSAKILRCLPASGEDLALLAQQLGLELTVEHAAVHA